MTPELLGKKPKLFYKILEKNRGGAGMLLRPGTIRLKFIKA